VKDAGHQAESFSIEIQENLDPSFLKRKLKEADALGIAYPIYGSTAPDIMWAFLETLQKISENTNARINNKDEKFGYSITTMALFSGDGALVAKDLMKDIGFKLRGAINIKLASNVSVPYFHYNPVENQKIEKHKETAINDLEKLINKILKGKNHLEGRWNFLGKLGGWIQRIGMGWALDKLMELSIDTNLCTKCMFCINNCPTENISFNDGDFQFNEKCTYCMRCYNFCPTQAILVNGKYCDPTKYKRHTYFSKDFQSNLLNKVKKKEG
jgi:hypothetical protein